MPRRISVLAFALMVGALASMLLDEELLASSVPARAVQGVRSA